MRLFSGYFVSNTRGTRTLAGVTLDYLAGEASSSTFDHRTVERIQDIEQLEEGEKQHVFALLDAFLAKSKIQAILK